MIPMFFQAIGKSVPSIALSIIRQVLGLMPLFYAFSFIGLDYTWIAFPVSETITTIIGLALYIKQLKEWKVEERLEKGTPEYVFEKPNIDGEYGESDDVDKSLEACKNE